MEPPEASIYELAHYSTMADNEQEQNNKEGVDNSVMQTPPESTIFAKIVKGDIPSDKVYEVSFKFLLSFYAKIVN